jgi:hypothetical protein
MRTWYLINIEDSTDVKAYNDLHDLLSDVFYSDDPRIQDLIEEYISEIYPPVEMPGIGNIEMGELVIAYYDHNGYNLDSWIENYMEYVEDGIVDEVEFCDDKDGNFEWYILNYKITCVKED